MNWAQTSHIAVLTTLGFGALSLMLFPSTWPKRLIAGLIGAGLIALHVINPPIKYFPWYGQPALSATLLLVALAIAIGVVTARFKRPLLTIFALALPLSVGIILFRASYIVHTDKNATKQRRQQPNRARSSGWATLPNANRYDCSNTVFPNRSIAQARKEFAPKSWRKSALAALKIRYPDAAWMISTLKDPNHFDAWLQGKTNNWNQMMLGLSTGVHEAAHMAGLQDFRRGLHPFVLGKDQRVTIRRPKSFHRGDILPTLPQEIRQMSYADSYLKGPSGEQGFALLLEELNSYTYSLFTLIAIADQIPPTTTTSGRDGLLTLMYYVEAYLKLARIKHPAVYKRLKTVRTFTLLLWDRALCTLALSDGIPGIGIRDKMLRLHVFGAHKLGEIETWRASTK